MKAAAGRPRAGASAGTVLTVSALLALNLAIVGPSSVYAGNASEYSASFWSVLASLAGLACLLTLALSLPLLLLPRSLRGRPVVFVFSLAALAWLQGNWLLGNFGLLDGTALDFDSDPTARLRDAALWIGGVLAAQLAARPLLRRVAAIAGVFALLQLAALPLAAATPERKGPGASASLVADPDIFELSSGTNIVLLIVDTLTSDTFVQLSNRSPAHHDRAFSGFVVYTDTTGAFPSTQYALPVMLGAPPYDNRAPIDDYMATSLRRDSINQPLLDRGFAVDWVSAWPLFCLEGVYSTCYAIPRPYASPAEYRRQMAAELVDLSLFRHSPHDLKRWLYADGKWRVQPALSGEGAAPVFVTSAVDFFRDFNAALRVGRAAPTFKIVHTAGGHGPFVLDSSCSPVPSRPYDRAGYEDLVRCSLLQVEEFLQRMKELGVYDDALIVVASDHGASFGAAPAGSHGLNAHRLSRARPLLAVKWPGAQGGLSRTSAPASIQDIAPTLAAVAGLAREFPGRNLATLSPGEERRRSYGLYVLREGKPGGHLERVERYAVEPESRRPESWHFEGAVFSPAVALDSDFVEAGGSDAARHLSYLGWAPSRTDAAGVVYNAAVGPVATVFFDRPRAEAFELRARLRARAWSLPQVVSIEVDGVRIGSWRIEEPGFREHAIGIPAARPGGRTVAVSFRPEKHQRSDASGRSSAFDLDWIRLEAADRD